MNPPLPSLLRVEVGRFRQHERRRSRFGTTLYAGTPAGERAAMAIPSKADLDPPLRIELVSALLEVAGDDAAYAWVTRPGETVACTDDIEWLTASATAYSIAGRRLEGFYVITREGWCDVRTGDRRVWQRLRL